MMCMHRQVFLSFSTNRHICHEMESINFDKLRSDDGRYTRLPELPGG
jgi:hypothetical protein